MFSFFSCVAASSDNEKNLNNSNNSSIGMGRITGSASIETLGKFIKKNRKKKFEKIFFMNFFQFVLESKRNMDSVRTQKWLFCMILRHALTMNLK